MVFTAPSGPSQVYVRDRFGDPAAAGSYTLITHAPAVATTGNGHSRYSSISVVPTGASTGTIKVVFASIATNLLSPADTATEDVFLWTGSYSGSAGDPVRQY